MSENSGKKKASKRAQNGVLGTLPATRPARVGRARAASVRPAAATRVEPDGSRARRSTASAPKAAAKPRASAPKATAPKPESERPPRQSPPSGPELAVTAARAVGELAHIGATFGAQALKRAASRLPRP